VLATQEQARTLTVRAEGEALEMSRAGRKSAPRTITNGALKTVSAVCLSTAVAAAAAGALFEAGAQALTVCGTVPAVGAAYRVSAAHLELHLTGHFADAEGDHEDATITMQSQLPRALGPSLRDGALFFGCPGKIPKWSSHANLPNLTFAVSSSWYESNALSGNQPTSGTCQGSYHAEATISASWNTDLLSEAGVLGAPRTPELTISSYVNDSSIGGCKLEDREILADAASGGLDRYRLIKIPLPAQKLWHAARRVTVPIDASFSGQVPQSGYREYAPGPVSTLDFHWQGQITFARAYTCTPNGCRLPEELDGTA
jgi:hypothetical protein